MTRFIDQNNIKLTLSNPVCSNTHIFSTRSTSLQFLATEDLPIGEILLDEKPVQSKVWTSQQENIIPDQTWNAFIDDVMKCTDLASTLHYDDERAKSGNKIDVRKKVEAQVVANVFRSALGNHKWILQLFLQQSFFNHSCIPNAVAYRKENNQAIVVVIRPIKKTEEIFLCYRVDFYTHTTHYRQNVLKETWNFQCICPRCTKGVDKDLRLTGITKGMAMSTKEIDEMKKLFDEITTEKKMLHNTKWKKKCKLFLKNKLDPFHWRKVEVRNLLVEFTHEAATSELLGLIETQLEVQKEYFPDLENNKQTLFERFIKTKVALGTEAKVAKDDLRRIDPNYDKINELFD